MSDEKITEHIEPTASEEAEKLRGRKKKSRRSSLISYQRRKGLYGLCFISLWLVGTVIFFLIPKIADILLLQCKDKAGRYRPGVEGLFQLQQRCELG